MVQYFKYHSTNCFFIRSSIGDRLLAIDAGWPGTLFEYARNMKGIGCSLERIAWTMVTHFHMDHAGLVSDFMEQGIKCFVFETQLSAIDSMEKTIEKNNKEYRRIAKRQLQTVRTADSRSLLSEMGIHAEAVVTDYHSPDSVTLLTDEMEAIVGDLPPPMQVMPDDARYWKDMDLLRAKGAKIIHPSHAPPYKIEEIAR
jgi:endoribonuclease LACTB2